MDTSNIKSKKIIFFDGVCNLCNGFVDYVINRNEEGNIYYSSLQSEVAEELLKEFNVDLKEGLSTVYFYDQGILYKKSTAVMHIFKELRTFHKLVSKIGLALPNGFRDRMYDFVAKNRYKWFGKKETCRLPTPEERSLFL